MNYYEFIAGLPDLIFDEHKKVHTLSEFRDDLQKLLSWRDKRVVSNFYLKFDNDNLLSFLKLGEDNWRFNDLANYTQDTILDMVATVKEEGCKWKRKYPNYLHTFIRTYISHEETPQFFWEDYLSTLYYNYLLNKTRNRFFKEWCEMNMNVRNVLTALSARREGIAYDYLIVGDNEVAKLLRTVHNPAHEMVELIDYYEAIREVDAISDLLEKDPRIDAFLWEWMDDRTFFHYFDIEKIMVYLFKLQIIERWKLLDNEKGKEKFRNIVKALKKITTNNEQFIINH